ncbi:DUF4419 domain-containing protein [Leptolyngbya sp. FACHB-16]|nr:DUF4419 domain-containing protein [Leptolyngbya sp. FACHB-8]MBD2153976.1 DUF4419 domain-containing protein [Leptolyngbya sp. FACHB-16]
MSGGARITGWITAFFPYLKDQQTGKISRRNYWLTEGGERLQKLLYLDDPEEYFLGITTNEFPGSLAKAPFLWQCSRWWYLTSSYKMEFLGGFAGVKQDRTTLFLRPEIGWAVREATTP